MHLPRLNNLLFSGIIDRIIYTETKVTAIDFKSAADSFGVVYETDGTDPIEFDEFYGLSLDNFATSLSISPTSITSADKGGQTSTITYTSDGNFKINDENISFATVALGSGSEGTDNTFDIVIQAQ